MVNAFVEIRHWVSNPAHPLNGLLDLPQASSHAQLRPLHGQGAVPVLVTPTSNVTMLRLLLMLEILPPTPHSSNSSSPKSPLVAMTITNPRTSLSRNLANSSLTNSRSTLTHALALTSQLADMTQENFFSKMELISPPSSQWLPISSGDMKLKQFPSPTKWPRSLSDTSLSMSLTKSFFICAATMVN